MAKLNRKPIQDLERIVEFDLVRATEAAALHAAQWLGKGNKNAADQAACDAIRGMFDLLPCCAEVVIGGTHDHDKGYGGGLEIRFALRTDTRIRTATQQDAPDSDRVPAAWAELAGNFGGKLATTRVTEDSSNPGAPNGWCLRHYGYVGVDYPGLGLRRLDSKVPLTMKFHLSLSGSKTQAAD
jgi:hypothetical protein